MKKFLEYVSSDEVLTRTIEILEDDFGCDFITFSHGADVKVWLAGGYKLDFDDETRLVKAEDDSLGQPIPIWPTYEYDTTSSEDLLAKTWTLVEKIFEADPGARAVVDVKLSLAGLKLK
jgi:hypothetical protein